ncbi:hypothetical protein WG66_010585, partial [Moniliophthora roreri]
FLCSSLSSQPPLSPPLSSQPPSPPPSFQPLPSPLFPATSPISWPHITTHIKNGLIWVFTSRISFQSHTTQGEAPPIKIDKEIYRH